MSGPFGSSQWMYNASSGLYGFEISNSLRFNDNDSAALTRTPSGASNRDTWTWSAWVKGADASLQTLFSGGTGSGNDTFNFRIDAGQISQNNGSAALRATTALFRDFSAWYHIVLAVDTTQSTDTNRLKLYVNGSLITVFSTSNIPAQNTDLGVNQAALHTIGRRANATDRYLNGYLAEVNFIDGSQLTPSSFGETKNDIWIPKNTSGLTFGTNGFRLQFKQTGTGTASSSTIGADTSGNDNHWTSTNLVASDVMPDSPTNNFATINPVDSAGTLSQGNLNFINGDGNAYKAQSTMTIPNIADSQKYYVEFVSDAGFITGILPDNISGANNNADRTGMYGYYVTGQKYSGTSASSYGASFGTGDQMGMLIGNGAIEFFKNSASQGVAFSSLTGAYKVVSSAVGGTNAGITFNFGQDSSFAGAKTAQGETDANGIGDFYYDEASSGVALCTANLPSPVETIDPNEGGSPQDYFNTVLYTGNGSNQSITGVGFQPDFTWLKSRSFTENHALYDSVRGATKDLRSDVSNAENTNSAGLNAFGTDGFTVGSVDYANKNSETYASWNWKAGTAFSNDASATGVGSIDSAGSVNTDVGVSIINLTGTGNVQTVAHGLSKAPEYIIEKSRDKADNWVVYTAPVGNTGGFILEDTNEVITTDTYWNDTSPTSTVWTMGTQNAVNNSGQETIAYCFHSVEGFSRIGSYTGNGNANGTFVYTGFRVAFILIKQTAVDDWGIYDSKRLGQNNDGSSGNGVLYPNIANAEETQASRAIDLLSNGFKLRTNNPTFNENGGTYVYMAFAEQSFKYANGR
mgnify:FL=1